VIPLLGVVLLAVLFWPSGGSAVNSKKPTDSPATKDASTTAADAVPRRPRLQATLEDALAYNFFNPLPAEGKPAAGEPGSEGTGASADGTAAQEVPKGLVQAIFVNTTGRAAIVDSRVVHVGDIVVGGRIVEITDCNVMIVPE
jgi:hypothetical protein